VNRGKVAALRQAKTLRCESKSSSTVGKREAIGVRFDGLAFKEFSGGTRQARNKSSALVGCAAAILHLGGFRKSEQSTHGSYCYEQGYGSHPKQT